MMQIIVFCFVLSVGILGDAAKLPDYLTRCKTGPDGSKCIVDNTRNAINVLIKNGDPKFKIVSLTPFHVDKVDLQATPQLKVVLKDVNFYYLESFKLTEGQIDEKQISFKGHLDQLQVISKYDVNGRILVLPIQGQGTCNLTFVDFDLEYQGKFDVEERKGKRYLKIASKSTNVKITTIKQAYYQLDNLFGGDPRLGPEMNRFLNENWRDVYNEVQGAIEQTAAYSIFNYFISGYLHFVPIDELIE